MKGWTQADLARAVNRDPSTISKIESGLVIGNAPTMKEIADALGIPMNDFVVDESDGNAA